MIGQETKDRVLLFRKQKLSHREIARILGISVHTSRQYKYEATAGEEYRQRQAEGRRQTSKKYYHKHTAKRKAYAREYYQKNKEKLQAYNRDYYRKARENARKEKSDSQGA